MLARLLFFAGCSREDPKINLLTEVAFSILEQELCSLSFGEACFFARVACPYKLSDWSLGDSSICRGSDDPASCSRDMGPLAISKRGAEYTPQIICNCGYFHLDVLLPLDFLTAALTLGAFPWWCPLFVLLLCYPCFAVTFRKPSLVWSERSQQRAFGCHVYGTGCINAGSNYMVAFSLPQSL